MRLAYQAYDLRGKLVAASIDAGDAAEATESLRRQGLFVTRIATAGAEDAAAPRGHSAAAGTRRLGGGRLKQLALFARQLHVLLSSGTPLVPALGAIERQTEHAGWRQVIADLRTRVEEGASLSAAMEHHPECFDAVCRALVAAGESSGQLAPMLDRLATLTRKQQSVRSAIVGALLYPSLLLVVGTSVLCGMLLFVLPRFRGLFRTLDVPLPPTTAALLALSDLLKAYWWVGLALAAAALVAGRAVLAHERGRLFLHAALLRLPRVGKLARSLITARLARLLGVMLAGQVPLLEALRLVRQGMRHLLYARLLEATEEAVARGEPMSGALGRGDLIAPAVCEAMHSGEQSGQLGPLLLHIADFLDEDNEAAVRALTSLLEPLILIALGVLVGFMALSMFLPLFDLTAMARGGGR